MSSFNPYDNSAAAVPTASQLVSPDQIVSRKVFTNPIDLIKRSYDMVNNQYGTFLLTVIVGLVIASLVPFGILQGPIMVGIFYCYLLNEAGRPFELSDVFKGFDQFVNALLVMLMMAAGALVPILVIMVLFGIAGAIGNDALSGIVGLLGMLGIIGSIFVVHACTIFAFPLMAEYSLKPVDAIKLSVNAGLKNMGSIVLNMIVLGFVGALLFLMCIIPGILFIPVSMGCIFLMYRDVFPKVGS